MKKVYFVAPKGNLRHQTLQKHPGTVIAGDCSSSTAHSSIFVQVCMQLTVKVTS